MESRSYTFMIVWDTDASAWVTFVPDLNNLSTYGDTREEAIANTREAIEGYLEAARIEGLSLPVPSASAETVSVPVP